MFKVSSLEVPRAFATLLLITYSPLVSIAGTVPPAFLFIAPPEYFGVEVTLMAVEAALMVVAKPVIAV